MIWFKNYTLNDLDLWQGNHMGSHIGLEFIEIGPDYLVGKMPVDFRTIQPFGILHGGASCVLSETLGSVAAWLTLDMEKSRAVGVDINASHIRPISKGYVIGKCTPLHIGRKTQVWQTDMTNEATGKRICISRLTVAVIDKNKS